MNDYKFHTIIDDGVETKVIYRVYHGDYVSIDGKNVYRRDALLETKTVSYPPATVFDFVRDDLNSSLAKDLTKEMIVEQAVKK